jgi:hypothetical protein
VDTLVLIFTLITINKLTNIYRNINRKIILLYCDDFYSYNFPSLYPSVIIDKTIMSIYTEGMTEGITLEFKRTIRMVM